MLMAEWQELEEAKAADRWELWMTPPAADEWDECDYSYLIHPEKEKKTMKRRESYMFRQRSGDRLPTVVIAKPGRVTREVEITHSTYDRFAELANSGNYPVNIEAADYGICWILRRPL